ncbi:MFS transporter [Cohnella lupini]|uniref:Putative MFS family arabinose efflux permease n=1 Tax=Cohnella lupini TaxID=1294267 RepID=A0A3D9HQH4_9BACL|nr:MFS transporter [Cohnella lupini]RED51718.1 putative MFS family arabinose efflux permease [Cohnella lupini]
MQWLRQAKAEIQTWNRNIRLFFLANAFYQIGFGVFSVLYNLYVQSLGHPQGMIGSIVSVQSLAAALMIIPIGLLGDRSSRKNILIVGMLITGSSYIGSSFAVSEFGLQSFALLSGLFTAFFQVTAVPFLAANSTKEQRLRLFSFHFSAVLAAQVIGGFGGGLLGDVLQYAGWSETASLRSVLFGGGLLSLVAFLPLLLVREKRDSEVADAEPMPIPGPPQKTTGEWSLIGKITFAQLLIGIGSGLVVPYLNLYFTNRFSVSLATVGLLISLGQVMTIFSMLIGPTLVGKVGQVRAVVIFQLLSLPFLLLTGFTNLILVASVAFLFRQALMNAANPIQSAVLVDRISNFRRGIANSLSQMVFMLGWASMGLVQPGLIAHFGTYWGYVATFSITGALYVSAALYYYFIFRKKV